MPCPLWKNMQIKQVKIRQIWIFLSFWQAAEPSRFLFETGAMDTMDTTDAMHTLDLGPWDA